MDHDRMQALLALSLVEGMLRGDLDADSLAIDTFDGLEEAAYAHAYLAGFLVKLLATEKSHTEDETARYVRSLLEQ